jgi:hypothetical protein
MELMVYQEISSFPIITMIDDASGITGEFAMSCGEDAFGGPQSIILSKDRYIPG